MNTSLRIAGAGAIALCLYNGSAAISQAMTLSPGMPAETARVADTIIGNGGIQTWVRLTELDGRGEAEQPAQTLFVPSDEAFKALPPEELSALLSPHEAGKRRAFLARAATATRISPEALAGRRIWITTLDGRPLVIDATGTELMVGDAEALDVRMLPDGRVLFVLDNALTR